MQSLAWRHACRNVLINIVNYDDDHHDATTTTTTTTTTSTTDDDDDDDDVVLIWPSWSAGPYKQ